MATVRLIRGRSYAGANGIRATRAEPYVDTDDKTAAALIASGFFAAASSAPETKPAAVPSNLPITKYNLMSAAQLKVVAAENDIDIVGLRTKKEILAAVIEGMQPPEPEFSGSPTMLDLMEEP